jgi:hypothetical protein
MRAKRIPVVLVLSVSMLSAIATAAHAATAANGALVGRVEFDHPASAAPNVAVVLPAGLFRDLAGLGDAALAGIAEGIVKGGAASGANAENMKLTADQLAAVRKVVNTAQGAIVEVRVSVYGGKSTPGTDVADYYANKLRNTAWDKIVDARDDGGQSASVFLLRDAGTVRGIFVVASQHQELVLANVVCEISPERIKEITQQAVEIGLKLNGENGLKGIVGLVRPKQAMGH